MKRISLHKVMAKLAEEQTPEMIELSMLDDLDKRKSKFLQSNKQIGNYIDQVLKLKSQFKSEFEQLSNEFNKLDKEYDELFDKAIDIGADKLADKAFASKNELSQMYGSGWDKEVLKFLQR